MSVFLIGMAVGAALVIGAVVGVVRGVGYLATPYGD